MNRKHNLLFFYIISFNIIHAQETSQYIISPAGSSDIHQNIEIDWTIGEMAIQTFTASNYMLTEGFHQPFLYVEEIINSGELTRLENINVSIWPNPTSSILQIKMNSEFNEIGHISLKTIEGRKLQSTKVSLSSGHYEFEMGTYPPGAYMLRLINEGGTLLKTYKIIKIN